MKQIRIYQENIDPIILEDDDQTDLETYSKNLSRVFENSKISILSTNKSILIIRPNKINSIEINEKIEQEDILTDQ